MKGIDLHRKAGFTIVVLAIAAAAGAGGLPHQKGRLALSFNQYSPLSNTEAISDRLKIQLKPGPSSKHHYVIDLESFEVYVPQAYDPNTPYGLLVWVAANPSGSIEHYSGFLDLMDKHKLIWVGANGSGNDAVTAYRRIPLALDAAHNMPLYYSIHPRRIYVAGISGGGRVASITAFHYSDVFNGGIFVIGANYWKPVSVPDQNLFWKAGTTKPRPEYLKRASESGRYVLLTGDTDGNRPQMQAYYEGLRKDIEHVLYIQVPGMGHQVPPVEAMDQALEYLEK